MRLSVDAMFKFREIISNTFFHHIFNKKNVILGITAFFTHSNLVMPYGDSGLVNIALKITVNIVISVVSLPCYLC